MTRREEALKRHLDIQDDIGALLDLIGQEMERLRERVELAPTLAGPQGTAESVRYTLKNILQSLIGGRLNMKTETEAHEFIEEHLATMREEQK